MRWWSKKYIIRRPFSMVYRELWRRDGNVYCQEGLDCVLSARKKPFSPVMPTVETCRNAYRILTQNEGHPLNKSLQERNKSEIHKVILDHKTLIRSFELFSMISVMTLVCCEHPIQSYQSRISYARENIHDSCATTWAIPNLLHKSTVSLCAYGRIATK